MYYIANLYSTCNTVKISLLGEQVANVLLWATAGPVTYYSAMHISACAWEE